MCAVRVAFTVNRIFSGRRSLLFWSTCSVFRSVGRSVGWSVGRSVQIWSARHKMTIRVMHYVCTYSICISWVGLLMLHTFSLRIILGLTEIFRWTRYSIHRPLNYTAKVLQANIIAILMWLRINLSNFTGFKFWSFTQWFMANLCLAAILPGWVYCLRIRWQCGCCAQFSSMGNFRRRNAAGLLYLHNSWS